MRNKLYRLTVLGIEQTLKMKFFIILNVLMLVGILGYINFGTAKQVFEKYTGKNLNEKTLKVMVIDDTGKFNKYIEENQPKDIELTDYTESGISEGKILVEIKYDAENMINAKITSNEYIDEKDYSSLQVSINKIRTEIFAEKYGASIDEVNKLNSNVPIERIILKLNTTDYIKYQGLDTIIAFIMYMLFIFVAATISSSIGIEKISRTTEYMLTGISEKAYLWYNILQVNIVFIIQMILSAIYYVFANIIKNIIDIKCLGLSVGSLTSITGGTLTIDPMLIKIILITIVQTVLCILILSIIQAIMTSKVNNITDISNSNMLVIMIVIFVCFICPNFISISETVNIFVKIISCLPILSVVMIPKLILLHQIGNIGITLAIAANVGVLVILSIFGSGWFKKGLLDTGNSKKSDRRQKDEIYDMNKTKFKEAIFKISISLLMFLVVSNILGLVGILINSMYKLNLTAQSGVNIVVWILSILPSYLYLRPNYEYKRINKEKLSFKKYINWVLMGLAVVTAIQYIVIFFFNPNTNVNTVDLIPVDYNSILGILLFTIQVAILPAIFEELLVRGAMLKMLSKYGNMVAMCITAICFALLHQNLQQGIFAFFMGIVLAYIALKTKSLLPTMTIHFLNNFASVVSTIADHSKNTNMMTVISILIFAIAAISVICLIYNLLKNIKMFKLDVTEVKIKNVLRCVFSQYMVLITLILYIVITIYMQILIF